MRIVLWRLTRNGFTVANDCAPHRDPAANDAGVAARDRHRPDLRRNPDADALMVMAQRDPMRGYPHVLTYAAAPQRVNEPGKPDPGYRRLANAHSPRLRSRRRDVP
jgi:hypothetical protein